MTRGDAFDQAIREKAQKACESVVVLSDAIERIRQQIIQSYVPELDSWHCDHCKGAGRVIALLMEWKALGKAENKEEDLS